MTIEQPQAEQEAPESPDAVAPHAGFGESRIVRHLGLVALTSAVVLIALEVVAIAVGTVGVDAERRWPTATVIAWIVIVGLAATLVAGIVAIVRGRGRRFGTAAVVVSVLGNPLVLVGIFALLGSLAGGVS
jgi:hypothetical protein